MDWYERTERQVGAQGIADVRDVLAAATAGAAAERRRQTMAAVLVAGAVVVSGLSVAVGAMTGTAPGDELPPGLYAAHFDQGTVAVSVTEDGAAAVVAPATFDVQLSWTDDGRAADSFTVTTERGAWTVDVDVAVDGAYTVQRRPIDAPDRLIEDDDPPSAGSRATPARPATPADPGGAATPAVPASPAVPADPAEPLQPTPTEPAPTEPTPVTDPSPAAPDRARPNDDPGQGHGREDNPGKGHGPDDNPGAATARDDDRRADGSAD